MADILFDHLSKTLNESGLVAYLWRAGEDRFEWAGDLYHLLGVQGENMPSCNAQLHKMINPQDVPGRMAALYDVIGKPGASLQVRYKIRQANGTYIEVEENASVHIDPKTGQRQLCGILKARDKRQIGSRDDQVQAIAEGVLEPLPMHLGRQGLLNNIQTCLEKGGLAEGCIFGYLLVVGIDHLSLFNDAFGAHYTDEVLEKTGDRLQKLVGKQGCTTRIDGDVFGILFDEAQYDEMATVAQYILGNFQNIPLVTSRGPVAVSVSIGGMPIDFQSRANKAGDYLIKAESAMQKAKKRGRNCFVCYQDDNKKGQASKTLLDSGNAFIKALNDGRVRLAFQPVVGAQGREVSFHECLIRYVDEQGRLFSAADFIPAVERLGLGQIVDLYALRKAIHELTMFPDLQLSVNVSHLTLTQQDWLRDLVTALRDRPSVARRLIVEITESTVMADIDKTMRIIKTLQDIGCRVALDDFGAGNTAFSQLHKLNLDIVKIDKSFIRNIGEDHNHLFVRTLQTLAHGIDVETVGEGAETMAEAAILAGDGVNHIQGYVYGFQQIERV